jgi:membrane protein YqaA with SNARE-associated domain
MEQLISEHGLLSLFGLSFLAATIVPLGSEWLLGVLLINGYSASTVVLVATAGNYLGACTTYIIGRWGSDLLFYRILRIGSAEAARAKQLYRRWGIWSLLLSWLPIVGDPLCLAAGIFRTPYLPFSILVIIGKLLRYGFIAWVVLYTLAG